jgi:DNA repair protein RAD7
VRVQVPTNTRLNRRRENPKKKKPKKAESDEDISDEEVDTSKYGRAAFSHKKRAPVMQAGKIEFCHICSQRFTITAYTKHSPDGEGLLCHNCGSVEQAVQKKETPKRKRTKFGKGTAKMILEGRDDRVGKLQDICIKVWTAVMLLIKVIARHIHDVEALGDIGTVNMDRVCQS